MRRYLSLLSIVLAALSTAIFLPTLPVSHAQSTGTVCIADISSTSCPSTPPSFTGRLQQQQFAVNIQNGDRFNAFDISVKTDPAVLEPASIDLTGSLIHEPRQIVRQCINNHPIIGSCVSGIDAYGVVSLAVTANGYSVEAPATGRLFSITYNIGIFGGEPFTTPITYQTGCTNTSNNGFCATITDGTTGTPAPENLQEAAFSFRDYVFGMDNANYLAIRKGETVTLELAAGTIGDYSGTVTYRVTVEPTTHRPPTFTITPSSVTLSPGSVATSVLAITTTRSTMAATYHFVVFGTDGEVTRFICCNTLVVENR